ncbi:MAG TPA: hypothetical protein VN366_06480, partial [Feifaniaceae bacterium]|nr:hypothetical protein [Feifaniaceae bacterium]
MKGSTEKGRKLRTMICAALIFLLLCALGIQMVSSLGLKATDSMNLTGGAAAKFYIGAILSAIGGLSGLPLMGYAVYFARSAGRDGKARPLDESEAGLRAQGKRLVLCALVLAAAAALSLWLGGLYRHGFFTVLFGVMILGFCCAYLRVRDNPGAEKTLAATGALIVAFLAVGFSGDLSNQEYDYVVNGIRFGDAAENAFSKLGLFAITAFLTG